MTEKPKTHPCAGFVEPRTQPSGPRRRARRRSSARSAGCSAPFMTDRATREATKRLRVPRPETFSDARPPPATRTTIAAIPSRHSPPARPRCRWPAAEAHRAPDDLRDAHRTIATTAPLLRTLRRPRLQRYQVAAPLDHAYRTGADEESEMIQWCRLQPNRTSPTGSPSSTTSAAPHGQVASNDQEGSSRHRRARPPREQVPPPPQPRRVQARDSSREQQAVDSKTRPSRAPRAWGSGLQVGTQRVQI